MAVLALALGVPCVFAQDEDALDSLLEQRDEPRQEKAGRERPSPAAAEDPEPSDRPATRAPRPVEEIIVTAQKREQRIQDVPISMSVMDSELLREQNVTDFRDASFYVPNVSIDTNRQFIDVRIRGFGSPRQNKGFEQSVGLVVDEVSYNRRPYWLGAIFDVDRIELIRGPQGTLFGKNTTAGAVNVVTKKPTDRFTGHLDVELGELDRRRVDAAVGGPVIPGFLNVRISGLDEARDGFVTNTTAAARPEAPGRMFGRDREAIRAQVAFPDLFGTNVNLSYEHVELALLGSGGGEMSVVRDSYVELAREYDPKADAVQENFVASHDFAGKLGAKIDTFVAQGGYELGAWGLDAVAGYSFLQSELLQNVDQSPAPAANAISLDDNPQTTVELRVTSPNLTGLLGWSSLFDVPLGLGSDFVAGFFFQNRRVDDSAQRVFVNIAVTEQMSATNATGVVQPCPGCDSEENVEEGSIFWDQTLNSVAGFGQMNWTLADRVSLQYGVRLTQEWKKANWQSVFRDGPTNGETTRALFNGRRFTDSMSRSEFAFTPKVALRYDWSDDIRGYASWGKGFKAGGFNETVFNNDRRDEALQYDSEAMTSWELGTKATLLAGAANLNLALFRMKATDLQVFTTEPTGVGGTGIGGTTLLFTVNAGEALSQGVEADFTWLPTEWLTLRGALGFNDTEFIEFPFGTCSPDRTNTDGDDDPRCDLSGQPLRFTPKWTSTVTGGVTWPLRAVPGLGPQVPSFADGVHFTGGLTVEYQDVHFTDFALDPRGRQPSFFRLGGTVGLGNPGQGWSLELVGENLNDVYVTKFFRFDQIAPGNFASTPAEPRLFFGKFRMEF